MGPLGLILDHGDLFGTPELFGAPGTYLRPQNYLGPHDDLFENGDFLGPLGPFGTPRTYLGPLYICIYIYHICTYDVSEAEEGVRRGPATEISSIKKNKKFILKKNQKRSKPKLREQFYYCIISHGHVQLRMLYVHEVLAHLMQLLIFIDLCL